VLIKFWIPPSTFAGAASSSRPAYVSFNAATCKPIKSLLSSRGIEPVDAIHETSPNHYNAKYSQAVCQFISTYLKTGYQLNLDFVLLDDPHAA
jgi:hypothetical protein